jgi:glycerol-3-phosphate acyltransferase PlsY
MTLTPETAIHVLECAIGGYLLGSIPFGLIATRIGGAGDIREIGSGNIGATNVLRTGRRELAAITLIGDGGKGAAATLLAGAVFNPFCAVVAAGFAFLGHLFPIWLRFRGGKGVATFLGILLALALPVGVAAVVTWIAIAAVFRLSSLAALTAAAVSPIYSLWLHPGHYEEVALTLAMALLIFIRHHENIRRLLAGTEPRIGAGRPAPPP